MFVKGIVRKSPLRNIGNTSESGQRDMGGNWHDYIKKVSTVIESLSQSYSQVSRLSKLSENATRKTVFMCGN